MGQGYECKCNKCGYSFGANLGVGFLFPMVYQKTVDARNTYVGLAVN